jgi:hypothetical protein
MSRLTSQTGARAWLRDALMRAAPKRLAVRQAASVYGISDGDPNLADRAHSGA